LFQPIPLESFQERTGIEAGELNAPWGKIAGIVSLRDIVKVISVLIMTDSYLERLLHNVTLVGSPDKKPYANCEIVPFKIQPGIIRVSQTFVERGKYQAILENFAGIFPMISAINGISNLLPVIVLGQTQNDSVAVAHYIPPLVEFNGELALVDGTHRSYLVHKIGASINGVAIKGVKMPFPCRTLDWSSIRVVDAKPPKAERYLDLQDDLFRDLKFIGIDG
jgi:hypothetical protein